METPDTNYQFVWFNGIGDTVTTTSVANLTLAATNTLAVSPFTLKVILGNCSSGFAKPLAVTINQLPLITASSAIGENGICENSAIQLFAPSISKVTYEWRILGSATIISTLQNPIFNNISASTDYTLTVRNEICIGQSATDTIGINVSEEIDFAPSKTYALKRDCSPSNLVLNANIISDTADLIFYWTGPNSFISTNKNPEIKDVTEDFNGSYSLEITNKAGCTKTKTLFLNDIKGSLTRPVITTQNITCSVDNLILEVPAYSGTGVVYNWFRDGHLIGLNNTNQLFVDDIRLGAGYTVTIKIGGCLIESDTFRPIIFNQPSIIIEDSNIILCATGKEELTLNATITGGVSPFDIIWSGPNGFKSFKEDPSLVNSTGSLSGTYSIELLDQNGCTAQTSTQVDITDAPLQPTISSNEPACEGGQITLSTALYEGTNVSYSWQTPNNQNITGLNTNEIVISAIEANLHNGKYILTVEVNGCANSSTPFIIDLLTLPSIRPEAIYTSSLDCAKSNLELKANSDGMDNGITYNWTGPNSFTSNIQNPIIVNATPSNNGLYELTITNNNGCTISEISNLIENINQALPQPIIQSSEVICEGGLMTLTAPIYTGTKVNYSWQFNGVTIPNENSNAITIGPISNDINQFQLVVKVDDCILASDVFIPNVLTAPKINPSYELTSVCEGGNLQLSADITNAIGNIEYKLGRAKWLFV